MVEYRFVLDRYRRAERDARTMREFGPKVDAFVKLQNESWARDTARSYGLRRRRIDPDAVARNRDEMLVLVPAVKDAASRLSTHGTGRYLLPLGPLDVLVGGGFIESSDVKAVEDVTRQLLGLCETELKAAKRSLGNPFVWGRDALVVIVRLPLYVLEIAGYDTSSAQSKLVEAVLRIVWVIFLVLLLLWLGLRRTDIAEIIKTIGL